MRPSPEIVQRDDGRYEVGLVDPVGPFETRQFAAAVLVKLYTQSKKDEVKNVRTT